MFTTLYFKTPVAPNTIDEILRVMPRYKDDLNAMCEKYGYPEVVSAIYHAKISLFDCVDWKNIEEWLDDYLWDELVHEHVISCASLDFWRQANKDVIVEAAKEPSFNFRYHEPKGHVKLDMTPSNAHDPEAVLNTLANYCYSLEEATRYFSWNEIIDAIYSVRKVFPNVDWERIEELLDEYLWADLIPEHVFAPVQEALNNLQQKLSEMKFSELISFWLGGDGDIRKVLEDVIDAKTEGRNGTKIVEERIRHRLKSEPDFFNEVVYGGICDENFHYILRCIHRNEANLSAEEWKEECSPLAHLTTVAQVADEYYGCDELINFISHWYADIVATRLLNEYNDALKKCLCTIQ